MKKNLFLAHCFLLLFGIITCHSTASDTQTSKTVNSLLNNAATDENANKNIHSNKINGISFEAPPSPFNAEDLAPIKEKIAANWIALSPYAAAHKDKSAITFNHPRQWWGEGSEGTITSIKHAKSNGLKVMLKPQVWVINSWVGEFKLSSELEWQAWEKAYEKYILHFAQIADSMEVELFCIGTEYRFAVQERPAFWRNLIKEVKQIYSGKLTYAANWDNYENVTFWNDLDYIGIDAYFPLLPDKTPKVAALRKAWKQPITNIKKIQQQWQKPILFTEYGYMSVDGAAWRNWENEANHRTLAVNLQAQCNAFEGLYQSIWQEDWFAGGFIWKWHVNYPQSGGKKHKRYSPQNKPVEAVIKGWYGKQ